MTLAVNGQSRVPPGFRFHPTEEELLYYYLKKKVSFEKIDLDVIRDVDLNKLEPWELQERCRIGSTPQNDWYFFSHKDKKYPTGTRTNRATAAGFWKATGRDKAIHMNFKKIGMRKTLVFYKGRAPHGQKTDWIMHEYRLEDAENAQTNAFGEQQEDGWVVCRVFKKRNHQRGQEPTDSTSSKQLTSNKILYGDIDCLGTETISDPHPCSDYEQQQPQVNLCKQELSSIPYTSCFSHDQFMQLPQLESPKLPSSSLPSSGTKRSLHESFPSGKRPCYPFDMAEIQLSEDQHHVNEGTRPTDELQHLQDWTVLDRLVASHLNQEDPYPPKDINIRSFYGSAPENLGADTSGDMTLPFRIQRSAPHDYGCESDLWNFAK